ncbi:transposase domain-containing protein [Fulvimonas yonginensis]|uniref:Transposase domain-containing protein n=1 Tax=Fulvimonas yonginensis TaxID=1495200 RepID=A0ABU8JBM4_9GAMM
MADGSISERWYAATDLVGLPGMPGTDRNIRAKADREGWTSRPRTGRGGGREYAFSSLPPAAQAALLLRERPQQAPTRRNSLAPTDEQLRSAWQRFERAKQPMKDVAAMRLRALHTVNALVRAGTPLMQARDTVAAQLQRDGIRGGSAASIARWQQDVAHAGPQDWLALLLPHYTGRTATAEIEPEAWELFKADYLRLEQPTASSCYDRLQRIAATRGWELPSLKTFTRKVERELPRAVRVLARQGEEALLKTYPAQERDRSLMAALQGVNADGHRWDLMVRFPDGSEGRPCILGWQDLYSGKLLAWRLGDNENSDMVRLSFGDMLRQFGIPGSVYLDNGRAFASKWMTGGAPNRYRFKIREEDPAGLITTLVGAENVHWVTPYHGQAKPIERMWRDFCDRIAKHPEFAGAYVGNNTLNKPENYGSRVIEWADFERVVTSEIHAHNARIGRRTKVCAGVHSFDQVFAASLAHITVRRVSEEQLRLLLLAAEAVTASPIDGSVRLAGNRYWTEALSEHAGRKVVLRVDPWHLQGVAHVYALDGTYIAEAPCTAAVGFADVNAAREHARGRKQYKRAAKDMLAAERLMDAAQVAAQLPDATPPSLPQSTVVAPVFVRHGQKPEPKPERAAATGTEGPSALDLLMFQRAQQMKKDHL